MKETITKISGLSSLSILGNLFKSKNIGRNNTKLVLLGYARGYHAVATRRSQANTGHASRLPDTPDAERHRRTRFRAS